MASQSDALRLMLDAISAMRATGYTQDDIQELVTAAFEHLEGGATRPYAFGRCTNCRRLIIGWSVYQWSIAVSEPCPRCGKLVSRETERSDTTWHRFRPNPPKG